MFREFLVKLCRASDHRVIAETDSGREAIELCRTLRPEVLLLDLRLPDLDGADVAETLRIEAPLIKILALSAYADDFAFHRLERCGVQGFVDKSHQSLHMLDRR